MCGICGIVDYEGGRIAAAKDQVLQPVLNALRHRGPDSCGTHFMPPAVLGATRLAILDLSERAAQPMNRPADSLTLVFNGEIYNYRELRSELESFGEEFKSGSDTEVVLALYARMGPACLRRLRGMFAFAVWDSKKQTLFLARDRVGEKPLVYYHDGDVFAFASEVPALLRLNWIPRRVDEVGLHLGLYYVHAPAPWTAFRDVRRLGPGCWMEVSRHGVRCEQYWSCRFDGAEQFRDLPTAAAAVARCLDETTELMSRSDVPLGATLSGGLDSGSVAASLAKTLGGFHTFRVSGGPATNPAEESASDRIALHCGTRHHQLLLPPVSVASFDDVVSVFGEPIATMVLVDVRHLAQQAKQFVTVALTGAGGDELFGGYPDHWVLRRLDRERSLRRRWRVRRHRTTRQSSGRVGRDEVLSLPPAQVFSALKFPPIGEFAERIYTPRMKEVAGQHDPAALCERAFIASGAENLVDGLLAQQLMLVSQYSLTSIIDAAGMQSALEFRSPFLDLKMIELAMRIPAHLKIGPSRSAQNRKLVLREAMRNRLPPEVVWAVGKTGLGGTIPYHQWLHSDPHGQFHRMLTSPALSDLGLFETRTLEELWLLSSLRPVVPIAWLWGVATIAAWLERYF
ncbi:MAG TPA: asparagine synthase (glutamine-hydrolyzing) [Verrucomicrobiae bacterium]|nr:asparagine synthase (glutamine-hydrolyzing) [Verrucomicrobiae bacterium]